MELESDQDANVKRRRAKHSKTRKGCVRCKQRHIKCDEERPSCNRCVQAGLACPGYDHDTARMKRGPVKRFRIIQGANPVLAPAVKDVSPVPILPATSRACSVSTPIKEQIAIDFFISHTVQTLAKYVPGTELWTATTFNSLLADAKVRNIVIAIGMAHQDMLDNIGRGLGPYTTAVQAESSGTSSPPDALDADRYYNCALAFMRMDISTVRENVAAERTDVAAACLLIVIYLSLHNRMEEAAVHMACGLEVVGEGGQAFINASKVNQEIYLLFMHFAVGSWPSHPSAPLFDVMQATIELSCFLTDQDPLTSLRTDIDLAAQRIFVYTHHVTRGTFPDTESTKIAREALVMDIDLLCARVDDYAAGVQDCSTIEAAFVPAMRARLLMFRIFAQSVATRYQTTYDRHVKSFDEVIDQIWQSIQKANPLIGTDWPIVSIYLGFLGTLRLTNVLCRHPAIRRRSLNMLRYIPQREGVVEAGEGHQLGRIAMEFEENGLDIDPDAKYTSPIPEENRVHFIESIKRASLQGVVLADDEIMVRLMYRPDGESSYVERRVRKKREHFDLRDQKVIGSQKKLYLNGS